MEPIMILIEPLSITIIGIETFLPLHTHGVTIGKVVVIGETIIDTMDIMAVTMAEDIMAEDTMAEVTMAEDTMEVTMAEDIMAEVTIVRGFSKLESCLLRTINSFYWT
jgi:hypothetical protein